MMIAVNTRLLLKNRLEGIGWFSFETLQRICRQQSGHQFLFIFDRPYAEEFIFSDNIRPLVIPPPTRHPLIWHYWFQYSLPRAIRRYGADLFFSPDGYLPLGLPIPTLIAIHDINFHHRPADLPRSSRWYYRRYFPRFAREAGRICTVSEYSRKDIAHSYQVDPSRIDVVYNGVNAAFRPLGDAVGRVRQKITGGIPYFSFVGSMHPRKNLSKLLKAFDHFRMRHPGAFKMVIVGEKMFMTSSMEKTYRNMKNREDVIFLGRLNPPQLREVIGASEGFTFVPLFEGFGIPLLEAMKCEVPILSSNVTSLPEIAADAALYVNPEDHEAIADGMLRLVHDQDLRQSLVRAGIQRATEFSWDRTASLLWESMEKLIRS